MSSSTTTVHFQSPTTSADAPPTHSPFINFNADCSHSSAAGARMRPRPRLAKLRKQSATQQARSRSRAAGDDAAGFNPFRSDQVTGDVSGLASGHRDGVFVFGGGKSDSDCARDLKGKSEGEIRNNGGGVEFVFSSKRSDDELKKNGVNVTEKVCGDRRKGNLNSEGEKGESNSRVCRDNLDSRSNVEKGKSRVNGYSETGFNSFSATYSDTPACNLSDEMRKLNIKHAEGDDITRKSTNSHDKAFGYSSVSSGTDADGQKSCSSAAFEDVNVQFVKGGGLNGVQNGTACGIAGDSTGIQCSKPSISQEDVRGFQSGKIPECYAAEYSGVNGAVASFSFSSFGLDSNPNNHASTGHSSSTDNDKEAEYSGVNGAAASFSFSSFGLDSNPNNHASTGHSSSADNDKEAEYSGVNGAAASFSFSSFGLDSNPNNHASTGHSSSADNDKDGICFANTPEPSKESFADFKPPNWDPSSFKDNLFPKLNRINESTQKVRSCKEKGSKCMRRKLKPHSSNKKQTGPDHLPKEVKSPDSSGKHSPMDFSPYQETTASDPDVKASEESNDLRSTIPTDFKDEYLPAMGREDISTNYPRCENPDNGNLSSCDGSASVNYFHSSGPEIVLPNLKANQFCSTSVSGASADTGVDFTSNTEKQKDDRFCFVHGVSDLKGNDFSFSASTVEATPSLKPKQKKKFRSKKGYSSYVISPRVNGKFVSSVQFSQHTTANLSSHSDVMDRSQINDQFKEGGVASVDTIPPACDNWRLWGNQAHKDGDLTKAEEFYTLGINSVPSSERSGCSVKPLLLCYSNRAATRMSLGKIREALEDCMMAIALDPTFIKVQMRTANCHLLLGEVENAQQCFNKCMESSGVVCLDRRVILEAAEGVQKAQEVVKCMNNASELLKERTSDAAVTALELVSKALSISLYSEKLLKMKAEALCLLQKYDAAIQLCEQSLCLAEKNIIRENNAENFNSSLSDSYSSVKLWRWSLTSKCYFHLGRLEASLNVLEKLQHIVLVADKCVIDNIEDSLSLASTIRELLNHKRAGNENFKVGKYTEAVENYTAALSCNIRSRPFVAICFCNRAAAHQALGQISDAIADCSVAIALDGNYAKAISRRATLHEMVRDYQQAACDLKRLVSILETQSNERAKLSGSPSESNGVKELRQAHKRLASVEDQAKKGIPLDVYLILGIKSDFTATDIKKAYHKAALKHHPDKAGQLLARSEVGDEGRVWREISQEVYNDADRLFKMIGEAYAVLSDPDKRSEYDFEEEIRKHPTPSKRSSRQPSDRTYSRSYNWKTYGHSYSKW